MLLIAVSALVYIAYSCLAGIVEGILYSKKGADAFRFDEHVLYVALRFTVFALFFVPDAMSSFCDIQPMTVLDKFAVSVFWGFVHPMFHDGFYNETRRRIDQPHLRWYSGRSKTSTAIFELSFMARLLLFTTGIWGMFFYLLYTI